MKDCDGFLSAALSVNEKGLNTKFGVNQTDSDQVMPWTSLSSKKINKEQ
jgi:hypothetical protein